MKIGQKATLLSLWALAIYALTNTKICKTLPLTRFFFSSIGKLTGFPFWSVMVKFLAEYSTSKSAEDESISAAFFAFSKSRSRSSDAEEAWERRKWQRDKLERQERWTLVVIAKDEIIVHFYSVHQIILL